MRLLRALNLTRYPLWSTIFLMVATAALVPFTVIVSISVFQADRINAQLTEDYMREVSREHVDILERAIVSARRALEGIANNRQYRVQLVALLRGEENSFLRPTIANVFESRLIETEQFEFVTLVNRSGRVVADTRPGRVGTNVGDSQAFRAAVNAQLLGDAQRVVIHDDRDTSRIEIVQVVSDISGTVEGFLIGALDMTANSLDIYQEDHTAFLPVFNYFATRDGVLFVDRDYRDIVLNTPRSDFVDAATAGQSGFANFTQDGVPTKLYYAPALGGRLAVITQTITPTRIVPSLLDIVSDNLITVALIVVSVALLSLVGTIVLSQPIQQIREALNSINNREYDVPVSAVERPDVIGALARDFMNVRTRVQQYIEDQAARTAELVRDIRATQEVARYAATQRDLQALMDSTVNLIVAQFSNIYHAQIFLLDEDRRWAVLQASTGSAGRQLLARGHRLRVGSVSVIGQVTSQNRIVVARDTATSEVHKRNEFLPDTRSELAIPLRVAGLVIGALDVQSKESDTFTEDQVNILRTMADQIAISIDNARLYQETQRLLEEQAERNRQQADFDWTDYLADERTNAITLHTGFEIEAEAREALRQHAIETEQTQIGTPTPRDTVPIAVPIKVRGGTIGAVVWELPRIDINADKIQLAEELVTRLAVSLENARLFQTSKRAVERERVVNEIARKLSSKTDISEILQTAVREVGQALRASETHIHLETRQNGRHPNGHHEESV